MRRSPTNTVIEHQQSTPSFVFGGKPNPKNLSPPAFLRDRNNQRAHTPTPSSRTYSKDEGGISSIHDDLLLKGKLYQQRKEALREKAIATELKRCKSVPRISSMGHNLQRSGNIVDRLYALETEKSKNLEYKINSLQKQDEERLSSFFSPKISNRGSRSKGKAIEASSRHLQNCQSFKTQQRMADIRREKIIKELQEIRDSPQIDRKSVMIAAEKRRKDGTCDMTHIDSMLENDRLLKLTRWEQQQQTQRETEANRTPHITEYAASLRRSDRTTAVDVGTRLYEDAVHRMVVKEKDLPSPLETAVTPTRQVTTNGVGLFDRHLQIVQKREEKLQAEREQEKFQHTPQINPVSVAIAQRLSQSTSDRLSTPRRTTQVLQSTSTQRSPRITRLADSSRDDAQLFERMRVAEERKKLKLARAKEELERKGMEECTFKPQMLNPNQSQPTVSPEAMYERSMAWSEKREQKLTDARERKHEEDQFSFAPEIITDAIEGTENSSALLRSKGFENFVDRQQTARQRYKEVYSQVTPREYPVHDSIPSVLDVSQCQAPTLGDKSKVSPIPSLRRPVEVGSIQRESPSSGLMEFLKQKHMSQTS